VGMQVDAHEQRPPWLRRLRDGAIVEGTQSGYAVNQGGGVP
jgi:hypothetical protein